VECYRDCWKAGRSLYGAYAVKMHYNAAKNAKLRTGKEDTKRCAAVDEKALAQS
jgi:hypothetical protein